jgi:hypothetical protein
MAKCRSIFAFGLVLVWTAMPALACLPSQNMTQAEMACCKKMAGDCHMGVGQHPCCKTTVSPNAPVANIERTAPHIQPYVVATLLQIAPLTAPKFDRALARDHLGLPPPAPPGLNSALRI